MARRSEHVRADDDQRIRLRRAKLTGLRRRLLGEGRERDSTDAPEPVDLGALTASQAHGTATVLCERGGTAPVGAAVLWAMRQDARRLVLFVDDEAGVAARLAGYFSTSGRAVQVRRVEGATSSPAAPEPLVPPAAGPEDGGELVALLRDAGLEVVVEHGVITGELLGLEVARLVRWPVEVGGDDELHLEAGVGRFDRDAVAAVHPDEPPASSLARTVEAVRRHRYPGAPTHPLQRLARERWLRTDLVADPALVGASWLEPVATPVERPGLRDVHPAAAVGEDESGAPLVVVCSTGIDPGLVPHAADIRAAHAPDARLVLALPERDHHPATMLLAASLSAPASLVAVPVGWG